MKNFEQATKEDEIAKYFGAKILPDVARLVPFNKYKFYDWLIWLGADGWICAKIEGSNYKKHRLFVRLEQTFIFVLDEEKEKIKKEKAKKCNISE
jgi:hypothetical protein